jgi:hypothetical protein
MENVMYIASLYPPGGKRLIGKFDFGKNCDAVFRVDKQLGESMLRNYRLDVKEIVIPEGADVMTIHKEEPVVVEEKPLDLTVVDEGLLEDELIRRHSTPGNFMKSLVEKLRKVAFDPKTGKTNVFALTSPFWDSELMQEFGSRGFVVVPYLLFEQMHNSHQAMGFQKQIDELRAQLFAKNKPVEEPIEESKPVEEPKIDGRKTRWMNKGK